MAERLIRVRRGSWIGGVCAAIADRLGIPRIVVRVLFVVSNGAGLLVYLLLWTFTKVEPKR